MDKTNIWILGKIIPGYPCYEWEDNSMPNLSDCDILIIANSFYNKLKYINKSYAEKIFDQIRNRFCIIYESILPRLQPNRYGIIIQMETVGSMI